MPPLASHVLPLPVRRVVRVVRRARARHGRQHEELLRGVHSAFLYQCIPLHCTFTAHIPFYYGAMYE